MHHALMFPCLYWADFSWCLSVTPPTPFHFCPCSSLWQLHEKTKHCKCLAFNRRGTLLATGCHDGSCVLWDFDTRGIYDTHPKATHTHTHTHTHCPNTHCLNTHPLSFTPHSPSLSSLSHPHNLPSLRVSVKWCHLHAEDIVSDDTLAVRLTLSRSLQDPA
jgi:WD40 repeat protein